MQVPAHSTTTRRVPHVCAGTGGGNPPPGRARRPPAAVPPPPGAWGGCRVSGQRTPVSDPGAAARGEAESTKRSAAPQPATAATRSPQPQTRPPTARRRAGRPTHHHSGQGRGIESQNTILVLTFFLPKQESVNREKCRPLWSRMAPHRQSVSTRVHTRTRVCVHVRVCADTCVSCARRSRVLSRPSEVVRGSVDALFRTPRR